MWSEYPRRFWFYFVCISAARGFVCLSCALFESALWPPCCSEQDAVAPVTKDFDQVSTLIEIYFMFDLLEFNIDNVFSQSGERFVFYMYFMPRLWLLIRNPNWSFHKFSVRLVKSTRIPICDALVQNSNCYIPRIRRIGGCYGFTSKPPAARRPPPAARRPPPTACNGVNAITQKPLDGLFSNLVYTLVVIVSWPD